MLSAQLECNLYYSKYLLLYPLCLLQYVVLNYLWYKSISNKIGIFSKQCNWASIAQFVTYYTTMALCMSHIEERILNNLNVLSSWNLPGYQNISVTIKLNFITKWTNRICWKYDVYLLSCIWMFHIRSCKVVIWEMTWIKVKS